MSIHFTDNSMRVDEALDDGIIAFLLEVGGEISSRASINSRVDTGKLKGSWDYKVNESDKSVQIGSPLENAIWEEFGTGIYSTKGGRQGGWYYKDESGQWHHTMGKTPNRTLHNAFDPIKGQIQNRLKEILSGALGG